MTGAERQRRHYRKLRNARLAHISIIEKLREYGSKDLTALEHAALWLVGAVANTETSISTLEAASPLVAQAWDAGQTFAASYWMPVLPVENAAEQVLTMAQQVATELAAGFWPASRAREAA